MLERDFGCAVATATSWIIFGIGESSIEVLVSDSGCGSSRFVLRVLVGSVSH